MALVICFMLIGTASAHAASNGGKVLIKTKKVHIKPGKTYKTPKFKLTKKMAFQIPIEIELSKKDKKKSYYIKKGGFKITLKKANGKKMGSFSDSLKGYGYSDSDASYYTWLYFYHGKNPAKPGYSKGKYYYAIKNTTNRIITVEYSIIGYKKIASKAKFPKKLTLDGGGYECRLGKVGPGIPLVKSIKCNNPAIDINWWTVYYDGSIYIGPSIDSKSETGVLTVKLKNNPKPYKINLTITNEYWDEE